jgi:hypothetical protein
MNVNHFDDEGLRPIKEVMGRNLIDRSFRAGYGAVGSATVKYVVCERASRRDSPPYFHRIFRCRQSSLPPVTKPASISSNHADPRTTKLYDRRKDLAKLSEIERRIAFE